MAAYAATEIVAGGADLPEPGVADGLHGVDMRSNLGSTAAGVGGSAPTLKSISHDWLSLISCVATYGCTERRLGSSPQ